MTFSVEFRYPDWTDCRIACLHVQSIAMYTYQTTKHDARFIRAVRLHPVASHSVPRSFRTQVTSYLLWSFHTYVLIISNPKTTISYPSHFVSILVITYLVQQGTKWLYGGQFVPKSFRTLFGHFVPILVIWWMDGLTNGRTCFDWNDKLTSYS